MDILFLQTVIPFATYWVIGISGAFGGFLYGTRLHGLAVPHRTRRKYIFDLGFINDLLVGIGGAIVIWLIVPGEFKFDPVEPVQFIRGIATAFLGGYGGYALIDRVLNQKLKEIEEKMEEEKEQSNEEAKLREWVDSYLREDANEKAQNAKEISAQIKAASLTTQLAILTTAQDARKEAFIKFIRQPDNKKPEAEREYHQYVDKIMFLFETLAAIPDAEKYHRIFGQLAFACKGKTQADYPAALTNLEKAIATRQGKPGGEMYEFNRAICHLILQDEGRQADDVESRRSIASDLITFAGTKAGHHILGRIIDRPEKKPPVIRVWREDNLIIDFLERNPAIKTQVFNTIPSTPPTEPLDDQTAADRGA